MRVFFAHGLRDEADWLESSRARIKSALETLNPQREYEVVLAREEWQRTFPQEASWDSWCESISRRRLGVPKFGIVIVPGNPSGRGHRCGRGTANIVARAISRGVSTVIWMPGRVERGVTFQRVVRIEKVDPSWVNGWALKLVGDPETPVETM